ncbi:MAG: SPOR domain-containing protein [Candidatus Marinimicrobia bacterium]|nr:SPOR domain-containing protein [Candidatus Neomarinimicrobiota bacterium]
MRQTKFLLVLLLLIWSGCQYLPWGKNDAKPIFIGEPETIIVQPPEDAFDVTYRWSIIDLPDESLLVPDFSSSSNVFTFTADVEGEFAFAVSVESYGEDLDEHVMRFRAMEDTSIVPRQGAEALTEAATPPPVVVTPVPIPAVIKQPVPAVTIMPVPTPPSPAAKPKATRAKAKPRRKVDKDAVAGHYTVQVSSWKTAKQAQYIRQSLVNQGYDAYIQRVWLENRQEVWWRVRVGDFKSIQAAKKMRDELLPIHTATWVDNVRKEHLEQAQ